MFFNINIYNSALGEESKMSVNNLSGLKYVEVYFFTSLPRLLEKKNFLVCFHFVAMGTKCHVSSRKAL
jgi:hypothetical protein